MEEDKAWATSHRYLDMTEYWIRRDNCYQRNFTYKTGLDPLLVFHMY
jgi:hypothetical protein